MERQRTNEVETTPNQSMMTETICCGCRPKSRRYRKKSIFSFRLRSKQGKEQVQMQEVLGDDIGRESLWDDAESMYFFDAEEQQLAEDEYPVVFTTSLQHPKPDVSLDNPGSLLRPSSTEGLEKQESMPAQMEAPTTSTNSKQIHRQESEPIQDHKMPSERFETISRRSSIEHKDALASPRVKISLQGYPGGLSIEELAECQKFLRGLKLLSPGVSEQVYSFRDIEEEPYTICRWLRATKFDADSILQRLDENQPMFEQAKQNDFFPDVARAIGAPFSVFLSQYPFLPIGRAKNGCPVNYFQAGKINPEGILCLTTLKRIQGYFWWSFMWKMKEEIRKAQVRDPDFVRVEGINIIDLKGLSSSALSQDTMDVIKLASKISDFFPETLHCMLILNAPTFFSMSWGLIKKFIDPRTASRIQVYSNADKGMKAISKLVETSQIPIDYGGTNTSIKEAFRNESADPNLLRQEIELLHAKKNKIATTKIWELEREEYMSIRVYTRSVSSAAITVRMNDSIFKTVQSKCNAANEGGEDAILPTSVLAVSRLLGPGKVTIEAEDVDDAEKKFSGKARGYFLVVGDVKAAKS